jgi:adenosylcobinamide-phosphate synthase
VRLGGTNRYGERVEVRPSLGDGRAPDHSDIAPAVRLGRDAGLLLAAALVGGAGRAP